MNTYFSTNTVNIVLSHLPEKLAASAGIQIYEDTDGDQPHNNMPPYYVLAWIMKL